MSFKNLLLGAFKMCVGLVFFAALSAGGTVVVAWLLSGLTGAQGDFGWAFLIVVPLIWSFLPDRFKSLHCAYEIRGETLIDAPAAEVWDIVLPQPGKEYFTHNVTKVEAIAGHPNRLDLHTDGEGFNGPLPPQQVVLEEVAPNSYFRMSYLNLDAYPLWAGDLVTSEYFLARVGDQTKLTMIETLDKLRILTVICLFVLNPCRDATRRIKALCEGTQDLSWMTWMQVNMDVREDAATGKRYGVTIGLLACVMLTLFAFGLIYGLLWLTQPR